ncbi:MAG: hypothetical protein IJ068_04295 [Bacilli bacterium]|nr:hypothetical protein [Bacilli bacterium]
MNELIVTPLGTVSPYCFKKFNCSGYLVLYQNQRYLLDAGNGISRYLQMPGILTNLKILITHLHPDHFEELSVLCQSALVYKRLGMLKTDLEVYIPGGDYINNKHSIEYEFIHSLENNYPVKVIDYDNINIQNKDLEITSLRVPHQVVANAFRIDTSIGSIVYSGDTGSENDLRKFAQGADLFICESTYLDGQPRLDNTHLYAREAGMIARDAHVKNLLLTHFWPHIAKENYVKEAKNYFENTSYAEEGKKLVLKR